VFLFVLFVSCKKEQKVLVKEAPAQSLALFGENVTYHFEEELSQDILDKVKSWDEYVALTRFFRDNFSTISPALSLEMSKELKELSKTMNDSLRIKVLNNREMFARLNVFYTEALRLEDMSTISSMQSSEVTEQVAKLVSVYNSINLKIRAVYLQRSLDMNVNFDESIFEFGNQEEVPYSKPKKPKRTRSIKNDKR
jgi:hypothetical protein